MCSLFEFFSDDCVGDVVVVVEFECLSDDEEGVGFFIVVDG